MTMRRVVVLPAPFGPSRPKALPAGDGQREVLDRHVAGVGLAHAGEADGGVGHGRHSTLPANPGIIRGVRGSACSFGERRLVRRPAGSLVPGQPPGEAARRHPPVRARPRARDRARTSCAATRRPWARRSRRPSTATSCARGPTLDDWMGERAQGSDPLVGVVRRLRGARVAVRPRRRRRARSATSSSTWSRCSGTTASTSRSSSWTAGNGAGRDPRRAARGLGDRPCCPRARPAPRPSSARCGRPRSWAGPPC